MLKYGVVIEKVEDKEDLTEAWLEEMNRKHKPERVVVEYNGMVAGSVILRNCTSGRLEDRTEDRNG